MNETIDNLLLTYAVRTTPDPLQVSPQNGIVSCDPPPGDASCATLTILVSNNSTPPRLINCQSIDFGFLIGRNARDFSEDLTGVAVNWPEGWNFVQDGGDFTATPKDNVGAIGKDGLVFTISKMKVNREPGTTTMSITETASSPAADPTQPQAKRTGGIDLAKFPLAFKVSDLTAEPESPVDFGSNVTLSWVGTEGATYELRYEAADGTPVTITQTRDNPPQPLPANGGYSIDKLQIDTTFYLFVTLVVEGESDPLKLERNCPVIVTHPKPEITSFTFSFAPTKLILNWATTNAVSCTMSGDPHPVNTNQTDDSYTIPWTDSPRDTYTLTATNSVGSDTKTIPIVKPALTNGMRVRDLSDGKIYLVLDMTLRHIPNPDVFNQLFRDWNNITQIPTTLIYPVGGELTNGTGNAFLAIDINTDNFYLFLDGVARLVTAEAAVRYNFNTEAVQTRLEVARFVLRPDLP